MNRRQLIIQMLLDAKTPLTLEYISSKLNVSTRTIQNDLRELESLIRIHNVSLFKKPRVGIWIEGNEQNKNTLMLEMFEEKQCEQILYSKEYRRNVILTKLLEGKNKFYIDYFVQSFFTSKSTIEKDLIEISDWLQQHKLVLVRKNTDIYVTGKEHDIRNALSMAIELMEENNVSLESRIMEVLGENTKIIERVLNECENKFQIELGETNKKNLTFHIAIAMKRINEGKTLDESSIHNPIFNEVHNNELIQYIIQRLERSLNIHISLVETNYIAMHLIGTTLATDSIHVNQEIVSELKLLANEISDEFIENIDRIVYLNLIENKEFRDSLVIHLLPTIYRLKYNLNLYNPLLDEIKENYATVFTLSSIINAIFEKKLGVRADDGEIAFIALHLSLAIENTKEKLNVAIVCPMGRGISRFLLVKLEENFPQVNFVNFSVRQLEKERTEFIDMVISTISITCEKPCVVISPILTNEEIKKIQLMINNRNYTHNRFFTKQSVMVMNDTCDKHKILIKMSKRLKDYGYVDETFITGVFKREEMSSTEIGDGLVLTHGFHESVIRSQIAFCKLNSPIKWNTQMVYFIVILALSAKDSKRCVTQMDWLYKTLNNQQAMQMIQKSNTEDEVFKILLKENEKY